jgi:15-cis-phytoene desaturase
MKSVVGKKVIILGAGVAGMSAAHELIERGFEVEIYERNPIAGGKARSVYVERAGARLPGEHGFRFFPAFYKHVTDIMRRIPAAGAWQSDLPGHGRRVYDNLGAAERVIFDSFEENAINLSTSFPKNLIDLFQGFLQITESECHDAAPINLSTSFLKHLVTLRAMFHKIVHTHLDEHHANSTKAEKAEIDPVYVEIFIGRIWQILTSSERRRTREYERMSWWDFTHADEHTNHAYRKYLVQTMTRSLIAANARHANAKVVGDIAIQVLSGLLQPGGGADRVLNGPTNEVWIDPWREYLVDEGVTFHFNTKVQKLRYDDRKIQGMTLIRVDDQGRECGCPYECYDSDAYYIAALPVEVMVGLLEGEENRSLRDADPQFGHMLKLDCSTEWMSGLQFYFKEPLFKPYHMPDNTLGKAHIVFMDSAWGITAVSQLPFWEMQRWRDSNVNEIVSVIISNWEARGLNGKFANVCSQTEIEDEVLAQIACHLCQKINPADKAALKAKVAELRAKFAADPYLDPDLHPIPLPKTPILWENQAPLFINKPGSWQLQPEAETRVANLFLAADYVRTFTQLPTMEAANEAARHAVNGIIKTIVKEDAQRVRNQTRVYAQHMREQNRTHAHDQRADLSATPMPAWTLTSSGARHIAGGKADIRFCKVWNLNESWPFAIWRFHDQLRYQRGLPWRADLSWLMRPLLWGMHEGSRMLEAFAELLLGPVHQPTTKPTNAHRSPPAASDRSNNGNIGLPLATTQTNGAAHNGAHLDRERAIEAIGDLVE